MYCKSSFKNKNFLQFWYNTVQWTARNCMPLFPVKVLSCSWPARAERWHIRRCLWLEIRHLSHTWPGAVTQTVITQRRRMRGPRALVWSKGFISLRISNQALSLSLLINQWLRISRRDLWLSGKVHVPTGHQPDWRKTKRYKLYQVNGCSSGR